MRRRPETDPFLGRGRAARSAVWLIPALAVAVVASALPAAAGAVSATVEPAASYATESPVRGLEVVAASADWAVIVSSELNAGGFPTGHSEAFVVDAEGTVEHLATSVPLKRFVWWSLAKNMLVADRYAQLPEIHDEAAWWKLRSGKNGARRVPTSYMNLVAAAPDGWLMRRYRTGDLWHSDVNGNRGVYASPFTSPPKYYHAYAGSKGVLVTDDVDGRFRYLTWAHPDRDRKIPQRLDAHLNYTCPTVTRHAAYCVADVGKQTSPHVGSQVVFLDGRTPAVNVRTFARKRGVELLLPVSTDLPQLATSTSSEVSLTNAHGRILTLPFDRNVVKRANGWVTDVSQVIRGLGGVLIVGEDGVYRLNKPKGKPHLIAAAADLT